MGAGSPLAGVWVTRVAQRLAQFQARRGADFLGKDKILLCYCSRIVIYYVIKEESTVL